jgi:hypothetical protein
MQYLQTAMPTFVEEAPASSATGKDAQTESLSVTLRDWFGRNRNMHCFLVVAPSQRDLASSGGDDKTLFAGLPRADVIIDHDAFPASHHPYLLKLDLSAPAGIEALAHSVRIAFEDRRPASMAEGLGQRVGGWLASAASLDEVAAHWSRLVLQRDDGGRASVLRFYDPRALALLWTVLMPTQQQAMLGPVRAWHVLDASARPSVHLASPHPSANFILSNTQWHEIHRHGLVNRALALHARAFSRQPEPGEIEAAVEAAARAEQYGLSDRDDLVAFIGHALAWHPQFDWHPKVSQMLESRAPGDFYTAGIGQLSADEIDQIRDGSWYERLTLAP